MISIEVDEFYRRYIQPLPVATRLQLLARVAQELAEPAPPTSGVAVPARSLLELEGLGADLWKGIDAQTYVDTLRAEWDHRP